MSARYFHTVRYLKAKQIYFQIYRRLVKKKYHDISGKFTTYTRSLIYWSPLYLPKNLHPDDSSFTFTFLNQSHTFDKDIDWDFPGYGKLWTYNLNYFDHLNDESIKNEQKKATMDSFFQARHEIKNGMEPYPLSLRNINWIKYSLKHDYHYYDNFIYSQSVLLSNSFEYHLMGNHLLENAFSLLFSALYFKNEPFYSFASKILSEQLGEQILSDGAHFERSPMYHNIILYRVLDTIHLIRQIKWRSELLEVLEKTASAMLAWISQITFSGDNYPMVNDSAYGISASPMELIQYGEELKIYPDSLVLGESGYRLVKMGNYECFLDFGNIGPDYIPGHAHSDTFSFELYLNGDPLIVDTSISTYENNETRQFERSTSAHNTVEVANLDQSEIWGAFRVARRAQIVELEEKKDYYRSSHDGYLSRLGVTHQREFEFEANQIIIKDSLLGNFSHSAIAYLHFPPTAEPILSSNKCIIGSTQITIKNGYARLSTYDKAVGFNVVKEAKVLEIEFTKGLEIRIVF